jgi:hypothetical protein
LSRWIGLANFSTTTRVSPVDGDAAFRPHFASKSRESGVLRGAPAQRRPGIDDRTTEGSVGFRIRGGQVDLRYAVSGGEIIVEVGATPGAFRPV